MKATRCRLAGIFLLAGIAAAAAAPQVPSSEFPGRARERFTASPLDRFFDPRYSKQSSEPLLRFECDDRRSRRSKHPAKRRRNC
jgi:hypothetical protein